MKGVKTITGKIYPKVGETNFYEVTEFHKGTVVIHPENIKWKLYHKKEGKWVELEIPVKTGKKVTFNFPQKWYTKELLIEAYIFEAEGKAPPGIIVKPCMGDRKINNTEILNAEGGKITQMPKYGQSITLRATTENMLGEVLKLSLWERDTYSDKGHDPKGNQLLWSGNSKRVNNKGFGEQKIMLSPAMMQLANKSMFKGKTHEYYLLVEADKRQAISQTTFVSSEIVLSKNAPKPKPDTKAQPTPKPIQEQVVVKVKDSLGHDTIKVEGISKVVVEVPDEVKKEENCACKQYDLIWGDKVSCEFRKKVIEISKELWGEDKKEKMANGLMAVMKVETSATFSPSKIDLVSYIDNAGKKIKKYQGLSKEAINKLDDNFSGAVGLIQFTKDAIDALNKENSLSLTKKKLALMSDIEQLDYVKKYFMLYNWHKKLLSPEDIYLQVFAPIGIAQGDDFVLYEKLDNPITKKEIRDTKNYNANKSVDEENNNDKKIQRNEILGRYRISFAEGLSKKEKEFSCGAVKKKEESNEVGVLEEMKKLVDRHIAYSQLGVRNSLSEKGLEGLDCSETVSIYLTKLGVTSEVKEINTGIMTTQKDFRKAIDSENIDFVSGSENINFKPQSGDIFVWRRSDGVGHTGIVYNFDEKSDLVTILEAIGNVGSADETTNVNNGGYAGKGNSRTAVYKRTGKALSSHKGWKGYFRPKN